ncbi:heme-binding domain-containing protein [Aequorivita lipolytica]|uniref:Haem-binding domain-containing protein n=1 Tax=Aequorivita lipolytica TaxID=153267 RepID=A0A5C6YUU8_9FLAO|nr:heme-binding domain-containing protein [Aequorivita lipolytica]TXD70735.1 hypothetical protein ESV24_01170 [Aequorivita lipolytica]
MNRILKILLLVLLVAFIAIQFFPTQRNESDIVARTDFLIVNKSPKDISTILRESCYDCHSNNTDYPWYNKIQPVAWFLEDHVKHGKGELNFNTWDELSDRRKKSKLKSITNQVKDDEMPLYSYTLIHRDAILSDSDKNTIENYMNSLMDILE